MVAKISNWWHALMVSWLLMLSSCGPLSSMAKTADNILPDLEACCQERLVAGKDVSACEEAFARHDFFLEEWQNAQASGSESDLLEATTHLADFVLTASMACEES